MATSASYDFSLTRDGLITAAYEAVGAISSGETLTAADLTAGGKMLNLMLRGWQTEGIFLWLNRQITLFLGYQTQAYSLGPSGDNATATSGAVKTEIKTAAVATAVEIIVDSITGISDADYIGIELDDGTVQWTTVDGTPSGYTVALDAALTDDAAINNHVYVYTTKIQRPLEIIEGRRIAADGTTSTPIIPISRAEYMALPTKSSLGTVSQFYYDPQLTNGSLYVWQTCSDVQTTLKFTAKYPIMDFDAGANDAEFPVEYSQAVVDSLGYRVMIKLGIPMTKDYREMMVASKFMAKTFDRENVSTFLQPDLGR